MPLAKTALLKHRVGKNKSGAGLPAVTLGGTLAGFLAAQCRAWPGVAPV